MAHEDHTASGFAWVTGGSRRIGREVALRLAREGYDLVVHYRSDREGAEETAEAIRALGRTAVIAQADLADVGSLQAFATRTLEAHGTPRVLVNNAAGFKRTPIETLTVEDFDAMMHANARSVHELTRLVGLAMRAAGEGVVVNITDVSAHRPWGTHIPYCASKAAVVNMTRGFAKALAPAVRVNAVGPGAALSPEDQAQGSGDPVGGLIKGESGAGPIAAAVLLMVRGTYLTGVVLDVDGGRSIA